MPVLDEDGVAHLLEAPMRPCVCGGMHIDYCRTCDEFYWVHATGCPDPRYSDKKHGGHRLTIVPFVEER